MKESHQEPAREIDAPPQESNQASSTAQVATDQPAEHSNQPVGEPEGETKADPVAISKSLRRVRASGPLIIEAVKKKQDEMNQIIDQAIEGFTIERAESTQPSAPIPAAKEPKADDQSKSAKSATLGAPATPATPATPAKSAKPEARISGQSSVQEKLQTKAQSRVQAYGSSVAAAQAGPRRAIGSIEPIVTRSGSFSLSSSGQLPPNGPSSVLAQASGLNPKSGFGFKIRVGLISLAILLATGTYFIFRDRLLMQARAVDAQRDLLRVEDQSAQYIRLGERDREQGQYDTALVNFQQALSLTPNNPNVYFLMAQTYLNTAQTEEALKAYQALLRLAPENLEARLQVAEIYRGRGNWASAYQEYQRIIAFDQTSAQAAFALAAIEAHEAGETQQGINARLAAARRQRTPAAVSPVLPQASSAHSQISLFPQKPLSIKPPEALSNNKEDNPDPRAVADSRKKLGLRYLNVREYRAAINEFLAALRLTPDDKDIYYFLGSSYYGLGQPSMAHDYYKRVDRGQYVQVAQSGAQRTEKAAREEFKRRMEMLKNESQNEVKNKSEMRKENESGNPPGRVSLNGFR